MTDKFDDIVDNLKQPSHWVRLPFMLAFGFVLYLIFVPVVLVIMAAQILFALLTGESNRNLRGLGSVVRQYVSQIVDYITYNSDSRPYPFADFPMNGFESDEAAVSNSSEEQSSKSKPAAKVAKKAKKSAAKNKSEAAGKDSSSAPKKAAKKKAPAKKKTTKASSDSDSSGSTSGDSANDKQSSAD